MQCSFVIPGDVVGSAEEFVTGDGTYLKGRSIRSLTTGITEIDQKNRSANVVSKANILPELCVGDVVVGQITNMRDKMAIVALAFKKGYESRPIPRTEALIYVSNIRNTYVKDIKQLFGPRDIVKAKIIKEHPLDLGTKDEDLGVIKAYCSKCATALRLVDGKLECPSCGNVETRKLSTDYGLGMIR